MCVCVCVCIYNNCFSLMLVKLNNVIKQFTQRAANELLTFKKQLNMFI